MSTEQTRTVVLRKVSQFTEVPNKDSINLNDILILVQGDRTKRTAVSNLMDKIIDRLVVPSAYDIAVKNGFEGTEEEWLESLKANGVSDEDFKVVVGKYQIVDCTVHEMEESVPKGTYEGNPDIADVGYVRQYNSYSIIDPNVVIDSDAFVIYHDVESGAYYTRTRDGHDIKWDGILPLIDLIYETVGLGWFGNESNIPTYYVYVRDYLDFCIPITNLSVIRDAESPSPGMPGGDSPFANTEPEYATMIRVKYKSTDHGQLYFYDGSKFVAYTGVVPYIQNLISHSIEVAANAASKLTTARKIELSGAATSNSEKPAKFDGSQDIVIDVVSIDASKIKGIIPNTVKLEGSSSTLTNARSIGFATKIVDTDGNVVSDAVTEVDPATFDGSKDVDIIIKKLNAAILSGTASISITGNAASATFARKAAMLSDARTISIDGAVTTKNSSGVDKPTSFDGSSNIVITVQSVDASKLIGTIPSTVVYEGSVSNSELTNTIKLKLRGTNKMYITGSTVTPTSLGAAASEVADTSVYVDSSGNLVAPVAKSLTFQSISDSSINATTSTTSTVTDTTVNLADTSSNTIVSLPYVNKGNVNQVVSGMKVFENPRARTGSTYDSSLTTYRLRNTSIGWSSTPPTDSIYGGSGAIYFQYS